MPSFRPAKMANLVRGIVSDAIANKLNDPRISPFASVTRVELSGDLQIAKVYISVLGSESDGRRTLRGLEHAAGHIQRLLSKQLSARHTPEIRFVSDMSVKGSMRTVQIIEESVRSDQERHAAADPTSNEDPDGATA
jgi:ribosome-binding factor A